MEPLKNEIKPQAQDEFKLLDALLQGRLEGQTTLLTAINYNLQITGKLQELKIDSPENYKKLDSLSTAQITFLSQVVKSPAFPTTGPAAQTMFNTLISTMKGSQVTALQQDQLLSNLHLIVNYPFFLSSRNLELLMSSTVSDNKNDLKKLIQVLSAKLQYDQNAFETLVNNTSLLRIINDFFENAPGTEVLNIAGFMQQQANPSSSSTNTSSTLNDEKLNSVLK